MGLCLSRGDRGRDLHFSKNGLWRYSLKLYLGSLALRSPDDSNGLFQNKEKYGHRWSHQ